MNKLLHPLYGYPAAAREFISATVQCIRLLGTDHRPDANLEIDRDFFAVNVAPGDDPASDDYILERLAELGIHQVRMDFSYGSAQGPAARLLQRLLAAEVEVLLDLLPPLAQAQILADDVDAQQQWQRFVDATLRDYAGKVALFEIGNTPNRGKWSGFSSRGFLLANYLAHQVAKNYSVRLVGPNVSDFEPLYNATYLGLLRRLGASPEVHSDNLFVERVLEPEAYDHRVLGWLARGPLQLNLVKKARILQALGRNAGAPELLCTYTCWTIKRLQRRSAWPEQKRVDYLVRYLALAAASGALRRVYWGPLICSRDGLIDDGANDYPLVDQVSFYQRIRGDAANFAPTPAFSALATTVSRLAGARCLSAEHDPEGVSVFHYRGPRDQHFLLAWTRDGQSWPLQALLPAELLTSARFSDASGQPMDKPVVINEHPLYIDLEEPPSQPVCKNLQTEGIRDFIHLSSHRWQSAGYRDADWIGARMLRADHRQQDLDLADRLHPDALADLPETRVLRDARNRLWNVADPRELCQQVTVKLNRVKGIKRITYRFYPSKGRRHWNNACEMLRKGVATPLPLAFYEAHQSPGVRDSWYLCEFIPEAFSARDVYAALNRGEQQYGGLDKAAWFDLLSGFVCHMHNKQVIHRDLSSGNLLLQQRDDGSVAPMAIDIGRARIWSGAGSRVRTRHRLLDLIRIAYKLNWQDRQLFIDYYEAHLGKALSPLWRVAFWYYDSKQTLKKAMKGKRRRKPAPAR
ncbi:hypothetical protein DWB85_12000 [Seongchinamella sediminis]|uniref:Protein kinase domain-containing protein n=1 Tax=Seongchinamella sediminis TaxID=2283635 RepID=A0A3L7DY76_9GAMM|nr:lipopolysaccharide kinase InaA family protein [Seongchinamella sediminis]RLQ21480.1 hypothetical protein DWB85_12000 [Seongchinamella sediminis]